MAYAVEEKGKETTRQKLESLRMHLKNERSTWLEQWREIGDYISPNRVRLNDEQHRGTRKNTKIIDTTAPMAMRTLAAGMMWGITSPTRQWFKIGVEDPAMMKLPAVRKWCDDTTELVTTTFNNSNLYQCLPQHYHDLGSFGTAVMLAEEDFDQVIRFYTFAAGTYYLALDSKLRPSVFMRDFRMTARQIVQKFQRTKGDWSNISDQVRQAWENNRKEQWFELCHFIGPNDDYDENMLGSEYKRFKSCYWERGNSKAGDYKTGDEKLLRESGYDNFPVMATRWQVSDEEVYGTDCPGMLILGDAKQLQLVERRILQAQEKILNPPMKGPESLRNTATSTVPGAMNWVNEAQGTGKLEPVYQISGDNTLGMEKKQEQTRGRIRKGTYETLFLMLENDTRTQPPTAEEIIERRTEKLLGVGPVTGMVNQDCLNPMIAIAYEYLRRQDKLPPVPPEMAGLPLKVILISVSAQAQKVFGVGNKERFVNFVSHVANETQKPEILDVVDFANIFREYADALMLEEQDLHTPEEVQQIGAQRAQAQAQAQAAALAAQNAKSAKDLAGADMSGDNALTQMADAAHKEAAPTGG